MVLEKKEHQSAFRLPNHVYQLEHGGHKTSNLNDSEGLIHPMCNSLLELIEWHDEKVSLSILTGLRSFGAKGEISLVYKDQHDRNIGFWRKILVYSLFAQSIHYQIDSE